MNISIGENIKTMRRKCGFTQDELAARLSVTPQAVSKWENGNGTPDIAMLVPLAQIFGITTDSLLGVASATYGTAHTEAAEGHEKLLMSTSQPDAEKRLAVYTYYRAESEKEPTNYTIMRKCINQGADISRYVDFDGFLSDNTELRDEIFADCERKNACISRYCEDRATVEKSDYAMAWIYIHTREFDKAEKLIDRLPSLESNMLKETIKTQLVHFQYGFEKEKEYISDNIGKLLTATGKEFYFSLEDYAWFAPGEEAIALSKQFFGVLNAYSVFDGLRAEAAEIDNRLRGFLPRCYASVGEFDTAAAELVKIAENFTALSKYKDADEAKAAAYKEIGTAVGIAEESLREKIKACPAYSEALEIIEAIC